MKKILKIAIILTLTNCANIKTNKALTPIPVEPAMPKVSDKELNCLSDETYRKLAERDYLMRFYAEQLRELLK